MTRRVIDSLDGPVVLVGHSHGGAVITEAGTHEEKGAAAGAQNPVPPSRRYEGKKEAMTIKNTIADRDLEALQAALAGQVFVAGQAGYDQARQAWNLAVDQRPSVVVEAGSAAGVA